MEDTLSDAPRATEYLGRLLARFVQENILPLQEVGKLIQGVGKEPGCLVQDGIAADILWAVLDSIRLEKGDSFLNEAPASSQPAGPSQRPASQEDRSGNKSYSEDDLREKSISAIREYYR